MKPKKFLTLYTLVVCAMMTALICIFGPLTIQIGLVPITLATLVMYLAAWLLGWKSAISIAVYILIGLVGLGVFSGGSGGPAKLAGPTGGYIIGYLFVGLIGGGIVDLVHRPKSVAAFKKLGRTEEQKNLWKNIFQIGAIALGLILATAVLYAFGTAWFMVQLHETYTLPQAMAVCVYPFVGFDLAKIVAACILGRAVRYGVQRAGLLP